MNAKVIVMQGFGGWFRRLREKLGAALRHFMLGRYGTDKLNSVILWIGVGICVLSLFIRIPLVTIVLTLLSYILMGIAIFRTLSRNTYKRYQENRKYLMLMQRLKDREHRYFTCPRCRQSVRVPKGKGKIAISCPKCKEKFIKKT